MGRHVVSNGAQPALAEMCNAACQGASGIFCLMRNFFYLLGASIFLVLGAAKAEGPEFIGPVYQPELSEGKTVEKAVELDDPVLLLGSGSEPLVRITQKAVSTFPSVETAKARARAAQANLRGAKWQRFPSLSGEFIGVGTGGPGGNDLSLNVEQPLWTGGRIASSIRSSEARLEAANANILAEQLTVAMRVSDLFFEFQRLVQAEVILEEGLQEHRKLVQTMVRRVAQELSPKSDLELAQARAAQVEQELTLATGQRRITLTALRQMTNDPGLQITSIVRYQSALHHPNMEEFVDRVLKFDPTGRRLRAEALSAREEAAARKASLLPRLSLGYQRLPFGPDRFGLTVRAQTNGGLSGLSSIEEARELQLSAEQEILANERRLVEEIETTILENSAARDRMASSILSTASTQAVTESYLRQFVAGRRSWFDVMNAVREAMTAKIAELDARTKAISTSARLMLRSGLWRPDVRVAD